MMKILKLKKNPTLNFIFNQIIKGDFWKGKMFASHGFFRKVVGGYAKAKLYTKIDWKYRKL